MLDARIFIEDLKEIEETLLKEEHKELLKEYQASHEIWDALEENSEVTFPIQELVHLMQPLHRLHSLNHVGY